MEGEGGGATAAKTNAINAQANAVNWLKLLFHATACHAAPGVCALGQRCTEAKQMLLRLVSPGQGDGSGVAVRRLMQHYLACTEQARCGGCARPPGGPARCAQSGEPGAPPVVLARVLLPSRMPHALPLCHQPHREHHATGRDCRHPRPAGLPAVHGGAAGDGQRPADGRAGDGDAGRQPRAGRGPL
jgi:hypothetical protein